MTMTFDTSDIDESEYSDSKNFSDPFLENFDIEEEDYDNENWDVDSILKTVNY